MAETNKPEPGPGVQEMAQMAQSLAKAFNIVPTEERLKELVRRIDMLERIQKMAASSPAPPRHVDSPTMEEPKRERGQALLQEPPRDLAEETLTRVEPERLAAIQERDEARRVARRMFALYDDTRKFPDEKKMTEDKRRASLALYQALNYLMAATWRLRGTEAAEALEEILQAVRRIKEDLE